ncbi:transposase [Neobacillus soli]|uniref:transposase n=1 Tax=Neobacillus soli TaxID=220688 RepID=UPI001F3D6330|nr:transposase [Neobacillus soli]
MRLRAIRFTLDSGEKELLITNIEDVELGIQDFKTLYFKRWGIETKYDELKNKLQIQKFTGDTPLSIEQDFYATMFLTNMAALIKQEADEMIAKEQKGKDLTYEYMVNNKLLIGKLKNNLIDLILEKSARRRKKLYKRILGEIERNRTPIRPGRSFNRVKGLRANKNGLIHKAAL